MVIATFVVWHRVQDHVSVGTHRGWWKLTFFMVAMVFL